MDMNAFSGTWWWCCASRSSVSESQSASSIGSRECARVTRGEECARERLGESGSSSEVEFGWKVPVAVRRKVG